MRRYMIFGAKSVAIDVCEAMRALEPDKHIEGFLVSNALGNPRELAGLPVRELDEIDQAERPEIHVIVATPEILHEEIGDLLSARGFTDHSFIASADEAALLERYYASRGIFPALRSLPIGDKRTVPNIYAVAFHGDKALRNPPQFPPYVHRLHVGCAMEPGKGKRTLGEFYDDTGENISGKNPNYCEMTAFYWIWKNALGLKDDYVGVYHYRRTLDIMEEDLSRMAVADVDVVLPFPMQHLPDIREHHARYVKEADWQAMLKALQELYPEYYERYDEIFSGRYFYNYNLLVAKERVFADYCAWVFPLLEHTEKLSNPKGWERGDRYTAYMSESLLTLYFMYHKDELRIYHAGRILHI